MEAGYIANAKKWMSGAFDEATRKEVEQVFNTDQKELEDRFYTELSFGTAGMPYHTTPATIPAILQTSPQACL